MMGEEGLGAPLAGEAMGARTWARPWLRMTLILVWGSLWLAAPSLFGWRWVSGARVLWVLIAGGSLLALGPSLARGGGHARGRLGSRVFGLAALAPFCLLFALTQGVTWTQVWDGVRGTVDPASFDGAGGEAGPRQGRQQTGVLRAVRLVIEGVRGAGEERVLAQEGYGPLVVRAALLPGETRSAGAWMLGAPSGDAWEILREEGAVVELAPGAGEAAAPGGAPTWAIGGRPSYEAKGGAFPWTGWLAALAGWVAALALSGNRGFGEGGLFRGALPGIAVAAVSSGAVWALAAPGGEPDPGRPGTPIRLFDGRRLGGGETEWAQVRRYFGAAQLEAGDLEASWGGSWALAAGVSVERTALVLTEEEPSVTIQARRPMDAMDWIAPFDAGFRLLRPSVNTWGGFESVWVREASGGWRGLGPWALGEPLPGAPGADSERGAGASRRASIPGWCTSGLPQGIDVFVGRLPGAAGWVRLVGFTP